MVYVALLRGINVGGNNRVEMKRLKAAFERAGMESVSTYINSGNVIFVDRSRSAGELVPLLEAAILEEFGFAVKVVVRDLENIKAVNADLPDSWKNDEEMKCDVMFLWEKYDEPGVVESLPIRIGIDDVRYVKGAVLWSVARKDVTRSGMLKIVGTDLYAHMTIRNCNTTRKLLALMEAADQAQ